MKKVILLALAIVCAVSQAISQDVITKNSSEDIQAKVIEVTASEIKFKKFNNLDGPTFTLLKSDVLMIRYENGSKDMFTEPQNTTKVVSSDDMRAKGTRDALNNYQGKKSGAGWTAATNIVISPVIGLIPAIACATRMPSDDNLNYEDTDLMQNGDYKNAYKRQAHKTKKKKIWTSYGVSTGVWLVLFLLI